MKAGTKNEFGVLRCLGASSFVVKNGLKREVVQSEKRCAERIVAHGTGNIQVQISKEELAIGI